MKLILIRHGEPDFSIDSLTPKGWREAEYLSERTAGWEITDLYCSPFGRARDTASLTLKKLGRKAVICDWLREIDCRIQNPMTGGQTVAWDMLPVYLDQHPELFDREEWRRNVDMKAGNLAGYVDYVTEGLDRLLESYGYYREGLRYRTESDTRRDAVVVCFCHFGTICASLSRLLNMEPHQLWQGCYLAPTSVTVLGTEERTEGEAYFRCQVMGDTSHLQIHGEPVSASGYFDSTFCR